MSRQPTAAQLRARRKNGKKTAERVKAEFKFVDQKPIDPEAWNRAMKKEGR